MTTQIARHTRHAELGSGSITPPMPSAHVKKWTLKQVQGDVCAIKALFFAEQAEVIVK
ncbi:hypothetical protein [Erythrobacter sp. 3-20A1M]|uniref:hypothetical protein n=1 Tax=Erythrobacter sp. 3-20A1M TaxID=2653850 RepID=UPI001BFC4E29|nr:hypothetical protein [Erythrobacter sp. 3-20A1M]